MRYTLYALMISMDQNEVSYCDNSLFLYFDAFEIHNTHHSARQFFSTENMHSIKMCVLSLLFFDFFLFFFLSTSFIFVYVTRAVIFPFFSFVYVCVCASLKYVWFPSQQPVSNELIWFLVTVKRFPIVSFESTKKFYLLDLYKHRVQYTHCLSSILLLLDSYCYQRNHSTRPLQSIILNS